MSPNHPQNSWLYRSVNILLALLVCGPLLLPVNPALAQEPVVEDQLEQLLNALEGGGPLDQEQAGQRLAEVGTSAIVPRLREIFVSTDNPRPVAVALAGIGTPPAMAALVNALGDEELTAFRNAAQVAMLELGDEAVPALLVGLRASNVTTRRNAAELLGFIKSPGAVNNLLRVAHQDEDATVRAEAVWALGEIGVARVRGALKAISRSDPATGVRIEAERALLRVGEDF